MNKSRGGRMAQAAKPSRIELKTFNEYQEHYFPEKASNVHTTNLPQSAHDIGMILAKDTLRIVEEILSKNRKT
jgi:hypothetical protein